MVSMRNAAAEAYAAKMGRMGLAGGDSKGEKIRTAAMGEDVGRGHTGPADDGSEGVIPTHYAKGYESAAANEATLGKKARGQRLDRPAYKGGGRVKGTTVNIIVAPQTKPEGPPMPPPGALPPMPPGPPPGPPPMPPGGPLPGIPMGRKHGGRVHMKAGAGGGKGRLAKIKAYGDNARS